jgi:hypothetical protein
MVSGHFSEDTVAWLYDNYPEFLGSKLYDFTSCQRPNGTVYGTGGTCRKGTEIEQRREESIKHLNNSIATLKEKRKQLPEGGRDRIDRLVNKLETDLKAIQGDAGQARTKAGVQYKSGSRKPVSKPVDHSHLKPEKTRNESYGFYGNTKGFDKKEVEKRWSEASRALQSNGLTPTYARRVLDSPWGRHLADEVSVTPTSKLKDEIIQSIEGMSSFNKKNFRQVIREVSVEGYDD